MERSIYEFPEIFRRVHLERPGDIEQEVIFLRETWRRHLKTPVRRLLDIASGDSPHGRSLAAAGLAVVGVDRSPTMLAAGRRNVPRIRFYRRAIEKFRLPEKPFDAAIFMSETFPVLRANHDLMTHLASVARLLRRGGLYCIDIDRHDGIALVKRRKLWRTRALTIGAVKVKVREFYRPVRWDQAMHSIYELECMLHFPHETVRTRDIIPVRYLTPPILELAARASGVFTIIAAYPDLSFERPLADCSGRWLAVLRRK